MNIEEFLPRAREAVAQGDHQRALKLLSGLERADKRDPRVLLVKARALYALGRLAAGLKAIQHALHQTDDAGLAVSLGRAVAPHDILGKDDDCFAKAVRLQPAWPRARNHLARSLYRLLSHDIQPLGLAGAAGLSLEEATALGRRHARVLRRLEAARLSRQARELGGAATTKKDALAGALAAFNADTSGVLCVILRADHLFRVSHRHPREMSPGPYRHWKGFRCEEAVVNGPGAHSEWSVRKLSDLPGDPSSREGGIEALNALVRRIFAWKLERQQRRRPGHRVARQRAFKIRWVNMGNVASAHGVEFWHAAMPQAPIALLEGFSWNEVAEASVHIRRHPPTSGSLREVGADIFKSYRAPLGDLAWDDVLHEVRCAVRCFLGRVPGKQPAVSGYAHGHVRIRVNG